MAKCRWWPWVALALAVLVYARIRGLGLVGLDTVPILYTTGFPEALYERLMPDHNMYRPVLSVMLALERALYGLAAPGYQLTNAVCYLGAGLAVGLMALRLVGTHRAALAAVLIFLLHPSQIDVVPAVERRSELLMVLFLALTMAAQVRAVRAPAPPGRRRRRPPLAPTALALLAMGSKDNGLMVLPVALAVALLYSPGGWFPRVRRALWVSAPLIVAGAAFFVWRARIVGGLGGRSDRDPLGLLGQHPSQIATLLDRVLRPEPFAAAEPLTAALLALFAGALILAWWFGRASAPARAAGRGPEPVGTSARATPARAALVGLVWLECALLTYAGRGVWRLWYVLLLAAGLALLLAAAAEFLAARLETSSAQRRPARLAALAGLLALALSVGWQSRHGIAFGSTASWVERTRRLDAFHAELRRRVDESGRGVLIPCPEFPEKVEAPPGPGYYDNVRDVTKTTVRAYMWLAYPGERIRMRPTEGASVRRPDEIVLTHPDF